MADEVARTALVFDATQAKKGAEEFAQAGQKVINADKAVATSQTTTAQTVDTATKRVVTSLRDQERFINQAARRYDPFGQEVRKAANELARLEGIANSAGPNAEKAANLLEGAQKRLQNAEQALAQSRQQAGQVQQQEMAKTSAGYDRILGIARQLVPVLSAVYAVDKLKDMVGFVAKAGSEWQTMAARAGAAGLSMDAVYASAQRTGTALNDNVAAIARIGLAAKDIGATGADIARVNETVTKLGRVSGASAQEAAAGMSQLAQALASGRLNGDELRSIMENMPAVARQIADGLGVSVGTLREMGAAGQLTADRVFGALLSGSAAADAAFAKMPVTLEQAGTRMQNSFVRVGAAIDNSTGLSRLLARGMESVSETVDELARRIEGDLTQRIKDLNDEVARTNALRDAATARQQDIARLPADTPVGIANVPVRSRSLLFLNPDVTGRPSATGELARALELNAAMEMEAQFARMAESTAATLAATNKKVTDGLNEMFKSLGFVVENGKLMTSEQVALARATDAVNKAVEQGGGFLQRLGISADQAGAMVQRLREKLDPLAKAMREMRNEADLMATAAGFERNLARRVQQFQNDNNGVAPTDAQRAELASGVRDIGIAGTIDAAEQARRQAVAQERLASAAGRGSAAMREAERVNSLVARGYEVLNVEQAKQLEATGKLPPMVDGAAVSLTEYNRQLARGNAAKAAQEARDFGSGASAAAKGAMLMAEAAGLGEAAQRAAAAQATILNERNFSGAEAARQRGLEEAKVVELTNTAVRAYERSAEANDAMAEAILRGAGAVAEQERAERQAQAVRELGASRTQQIAAVMTAYDTERESRLKRISATETVALQQQAQGTLAVAAATAQGTAAVEEAKIQADLLTRARKAGLDTVDDFIKKYPNEAKAVRDLAEANKQLAVQQALVGQRQDIAQVQAELSLVNQLPEVRTRELALLRAKLELQRLNVDEASKEGQEYLNNAQILADVNDQLRVQNEIRDTAKGIAADVSQFLVDGFVNVENSGKSVFKNIWDGAVAGGKRFLAKIAALFLEQKVILPITMELLGSFPGLAGTRSASGASGGSSSGFSLPNISGGGLLDKGWNWLFGSGAGAATLPTGVVAASGPVSAITSGSTVGMFTSEAAMAGSGFATGSGTAAAGAGFLSGAMSWMPWVALAMMGKQIFNSFGPTGNKIGIGLLGPSIEEIFAKPELAIAPLIGLPFLNMFMNMKESNKGAEYSFMTDADWTTQFEGDKHPEQMALVKSFSEPLQDAIVRMEDRLGIRRQDDATIGANFGIKEGNSFFYDRGPRDGGIENRQIFKFDPEDAASVQSALDGLMMAFVKDADWSAIGARIGERAAADVAIALENSAATTLDELLADISFAESFNTFAELGSGALDPLALATKTFADAGKAAAASVATAADTFKTKATDLGLGLEVLEDGTTRADQATKGYVMSLLGLEAPMTELQAATITAEAYVAELVPTLERLGFTADEVATITAAAIDKMTQAAQQAAIAAQTASTNLLNSTIYGSNYQPPADSFLYGLVGAKYDIPSGGGAFAPLVSALERTRSGDRAALEEVFSRTVANLNKGVFTDQERAAVEQYAAGLYNQAQQRLIRNNPGTVANDNGSVTSSGGSGSSGGAANDNSARDAINSQIDGLRELADIQQDAAREAERLANAFKSAADSLRLYRLGLLTDPTNNPASLGDQLAEAQRQQASALARVLAGGPDAPDAARELQQVSETVLQLGRSVFGSSPQYVALFDRTIGMLTQAESAANTFETQQLALAATANAELARLNDQIEALRGQLSSSSGGGGSTGGGSTGGGGTTGGGTTGGSYAFGYSGLGRQQGESADAFIRRQFPKVAASMGSAVITEQAGYNWAQSLHASGLSGLTNAGYFSAALKAGFPGPFVGSAHTDFLSPGGVAVDARWQSFITELRKLTSVPVGFFGYPFAQGGLVSGGVPGMDSVPAMLMPGERVFSVPHSRIIEGLALRSGNDNGSRELVTETRAMNRRLDMLLTRVDRLESVSRSGNATREAMRDEARAARASKAGKIGSAPIRSGKQAA